MYPENTESTEQFKVTTKDVLSSRDKVFSSLIPDRVPAPVNLSDSLCQCDGTTFLDSDGNVQGNCKAADYTDRKLCYLNSDNETIEACGDSFDYDTRYHKLKS